MWSDFRTYILLTLMVLALVIVVIKSMVNTEKVESVKIKLNRAYLILNIIYILLAGFLYLNIYFKIF